MEGGSGMPAKKTKNKKSRPAISPAAAENKLISAAYDLAEKYILDGTASSQILTHFLKLGTRYHELELKKLEHDIELSKSKKKQIDTNEAAAKIASEALAAMKRYSGQQYEYDEDDEEEDEYYD